MRSSVRTTGWPGAPGKPSESRTGCRCWAWTPCRKEGLDALPEGGLQDVLDGVLTATYIYPTRGDLVMKLAVDILSGNEYPRETMLESALVDSHNAAMVLMQEHEITDQREMVEKVSAQLDSSLSEYNTQRLVLYLLIGLTTLLILLFTISFFFYNRMRRFNTELERRNEELHLLSRKLEETTDAKLEFFTSVSHEFRTPLSLIAGPLAPGRMSIFSSGW